MKPQVLIVDDDATFRGDLKLLLNSEFECYEAGTGEEAFNLMNRESFQAVLLDLMLGEKENGLDILERMLMLDTNIPVLMITEYASVDSAVEAMKRGAYTYISKVTRADELIELLSKAIHTKKTYDHAKVLREEVNQDFYRIIGQSPQMTALQRKIELFAQNLQTVLIQGESGTGKELVARQIHQKSNMKNRPFVAVNCAAIPKDLIESELFGHEPGAFTGANKRKQGKIELAADGIIFFDEIGELDLNAQSKLLRLLEEREFQRVGGLKNLKTDAKVIAATNRDLEKMIGDGQFREDLFYRLEMLTISVPPLRDRKGDIELLINHFLAKACYEMAAKPKIVSENALQACLEYDWPGNVRELRNAITSAAIIAGDDDIRRDHLNRRILKWANTSTSEKIPETWEEMDLLRKEAADKAGREVEKRYLQNLLDKFEGNVAQAAKHEGLNRSNLYRMMKRCDLL